MKECPKCHKKEIIGIEYPINHPCHYDGVSEWSCESCGKEFNHYRSAKRIYCSLKCKTANGNVERICAHCGKKFLATKSLVKMGWRKYCSMKCYTLERGNKTSIRRFGLFFQPREGYWYNTNLRKFLHVLIWEKYHKKKVPKTHCIHHKDGNPQNNIISNLELMTKSNHASHHGRLRKLSAFGKLEGKE